MNRTSIFSKLDRLKFSIFFLKTTPRQFIKNQKVCSMKHYTCLLCLYGRIGQNCSLAAKFVPTWQDNCEKIHNAFSGRSIFIGKQAICGILEFNFYFRRWRNQKWSSPIIANCSIEWRQARMDLHIFRNALKYRISCCYKIIILISGMWFLNVKLALNSCFLVFFATICCNI